jgi:pimeloyl-ACP methyl ester carboxylesterase
MTELLEIGDASLSYAVRGRGRGLLVPWCNLPWLDMPFIDALSERFTVVLASPRGYQGSTRLTETQAYDTDLLVADLLAVCDHTGLEVFSVLGYSLTAAMAAWLARESMRVEAVIVGGFPLLGSYESVLRRAEHNAAQLTCDERAAKAQGLEFDPRAVLAFYQALAQLSDGALIADVKCPVLAFWATNDTLLQSFNMPPDYGRALIDRGVATIELDSGDHLGAILELGTVLEDVTAWVDRVTSDRRNGHLGS